MEPENGPPGKEIPFGNYMKLSFSSSMLNFWDCNTLLHLPLYLWYVDILRFIELVGLSYICK